MRRVLEKHARPAAASAAPGGCCGCCGPTLGARWKDKVRLPCPPLPIPRIRDSVFFPPLSQFVPVNVCPSPVSLFLLIILLSCHHWDKTKVLTLLNECWVHKVPVKTPGRLSSFLYIGWQCVRVDKSKLAWPQWVTADESQSESPVWLITKLCQGQVWPPIPYSRQILSSGHLLSFVHCPISETNYVTWY